MTHPDLTRSDDQSPPLAEEDISSDREWVFYDEIGTFTEEEAKEILRGLREKRLAH